MIDSNGVTLYETEYKGLLYEMVRRNDVATLKCYIEHRQKKKKVLHQYESYMDDPFWIAAAHGSTNALCALLDLYEADPAQTQALNKETRGSSVLNTACEYGQLKTVKVLLDRDRPLGKMYAEDSDRGGALLFAGISLVSVGGFELRKRHHDNDKNCLRDYIAWSEELICLLLDRGASIHNAVRIICFVDAEVQHKLPRNQQQLQRPFRWSDDFSGIYRIL